MNLIVNAIGTDGREHIVERIEVKELSKKIGSVLYGYNGEKVSGLYTGTKERCTRIANILRENMSREVYIARTLGEDIRKLTVDFRMLEEMIEINEGVSRQER